MDTNLFRIAGLNISIIFSDNTAGSMSLLPAFEPFRVSADTQNGSLLFQLTVDDTLRPVSKNQRERIRTFDTGNGDTIVDRLADGGYQYIIKDLHGRDCCLLLTNKDFSDCRCALNGTHDMQRFGLNNALMLVYAFAGSSQQTILIHASLVRHRGYGYAFIAKSGTGKSTQVALWLKHIPDCDLMNDDNPVVRIVDGKPRIFGSPWSGKTPCYRNVEAPLGAITRIDRATTNSIEQVTPVMAFASILPACSTMKWDKDIFNNICNTITHIIETTAIYTLHCRPDEEAAQICNKTISIKQK